MDRFLEKLTSQYGLTPFLICLAALVVIFWIVAHGMAAPGGHVSVLWGLVEYTKDGAPASESQAGAELANTGAEARAAVATPSVPTPTIEVTNQATVPSVLAHSVSDGDAKQVIEGTRRARGLRQLSAIESGTSVHNIPLGTYAFTHSAKFTPWDEPYLNVDFTVERFNSIPTFYFEIQKAVDGHLWLIAFASELDANRMTTGIDGAVEVTLFPIPWGSARTLVAIPDTIPGRSFQRKLQIEENSELWALEVRLGRGLPKLIESEREKVEQ